MDILTLLGIAFSLAMDAFAVSLGISLSLKKISKRQYFRLCWHFGLFQFFMPIVGWLLGECAGQLFFSASRWIAFGILSLLGINMIRNAWKSGTAERKVSDPTKGASLLLLSLATSIDAFAVGLSLALLGEGIMTTCIVIGLVAFLMTWVGMRFGSMLGSKTGDLAEMLGGAVLLLIGIKIIIGM